MPSQALSTEFWSREGERQDTEVEAHERPVTPSVSRGSEPQSAGESPWGLQGSCNPRSSERPLGPVALHLRLAAAPGESELPRF